jgi:hypothetical protein
VAARDASLDALVLQVVAAFAGGGVLLLRAKRSSLAGVDRHAEASAKERRPEADPNGSVAAALSCRSGSGTDYFREVALSSPLGVNVPPALAIAVVDMSMTNWVGQQGGTLLSGYDRNDQSPALGGSSGRVNGAMKEE